MLGRIARVGAVALAGFAFVGCRQLARFVDAGDASADDAAAEASTVSSDVPPPDDALPAATSTELAGRGRHLLEAIAKDDSDFAADILFPRDGWVAARDGADPGKEWSRRVAAPFRRAVHLLAKRGAASGAEFVSLELGRSMQQQTVKRHAWKRPLWTVQQSRITFTVDGRTRVLSIREMTAWRGAWYVTRLR